VSGADGDDDSRLIVLGKMSAPFGVKGWVKVTSFTKPPEGILKYKNWSVVKNGSERKLGLLDRDAAALLTHSEIRVERQDLPASDDSFYWADLIGLQVTTKEGVSLGLVDSLMETGANDVLVVKGDRERLVPWIEGDVVIDVDLAAGAIRVDWDPEF